MSLRERTRPGLGIIEPCLPSPAKAPPQSERPRIARDLVAAARLQSATQTLPASFQRPSSATLQRASLCFPGPQALGEQRKRLLDQR